MNIKRYFRFRFYRAKPVRDRGGPDPSGEVIGGGIARVAGHTGVEKAERFERV
jgi:hypothetical protein